MLFFPHKKLWIQWLIFTSSDVSCWQFSMALFHSEVLRLTLVSKCAKCAQAASLREVVRRTKNSIIKSVNFNPSLKKSQLFFFLEMHRIQLFLHSSFW